jgi:hypothetical protein
MKLMFISDAKQHPEFIDEKTAEDSFRAFAFLFFTFRGL